MRTLLIFTLLCGAALSQDLKGVEACNEAIRLIDEDQFGLALKVLETAAGSMDKEDEWLWWGNKGLAHRGLRQDQKALDHFNKAVELSPRCWFVIYRARLLNEFGRYDEALKDLQAPVDKSYEASRKELRALIEGPYRKRWPRAYRKLEYTGKLAHYYVVSDVGTTPEEMDRLEAEAAKLDPADKMYASKLDRLLKPSNDLVNVYHMLEASRKQYLKFVSMTDADLPKGKVFKVFFLRDQQAFLDFHKECGGEEGYENAAGYYDPNYKHIQLYSEEDAWKICGISSESLDTFWHEGWHQFFDVLTEQKPIWMNEGLAEFLGKGVVSSDGSQITLGQLQKEGSTRVTRYERIQEEIKAGRHMKWRELFRIDSKKWNDGDSHLLYAQSWAVCYYAMKGNNEAFRKDFFKLFRELVKGRKQEEVLKELFPDAKLDAYEKQWLEYMKGL